MICAEVRTQIPVPRTYPQWLECLAMLEERPPHRSGVCAAMAQGTFAGSPAALAGLSQQMAQSIQKSLSRITRRFLRELNDCLSFHDLAQAELLYKGLRRDIHAVLFFTELEFLPRDYRDRLRDSITAEMSRFWDRTRQILRQQAMEYPDPELEDAVFLIGRIKLFPKEQ